MALSVADNGLLLRNALLPYTLGNHFATASVAISSPSSAALTLIHFADREEPSRADVERRRINFSVIIVRGVNVQRQFCRDNFLAIRRRSPPFPWSYGWVFCHVIWHRCRIIDR